MTESESIGLAWAAAVRVALEEIRRIDDTTWPEDEKSRQKKIILEHHSAQWLWEGWNRSQYLRSMNGNSKLDFAETPTQQLML